MSQITKETIDKIEELVKKGEEPKIVEILGRTYCNKNLTEYRERPKSLEPLFFKDLTSMINYIDTELEHPNINRKILIKCDFDEVKVILEPNEKGDICEIAHVTPLLPRITFDSYIGLEEFIIQALTKFEQTENTINLVELLSKFQVNQTVETLDDGMTQKIVVSNGTGLNEKVQVNPIVRLKAFRTFREVEQVEVLYLLRVHKDGRIALFEADGGAWKEVAKSRVHDYLVKAFSDEKYIGKVVVL